MAIINIGDNSVRLMSQAWNSDPLLGSTFVDTYEGDEDELKAALFPFAAAGFRVSTFQEEGPVWRGTVTFTPSEGDTGLPEITDQWEFDTEFVQEDLYSNPRVLALATTEDTLSVWKKDIEQAIQDKKTNAEFLATGPSSEEYSLFLLRNRGAQASEVRRVVLRRQRTLPFGSAARMIATAIEKIYTTSALIAAYGIPSAVSSAMPSLPATAPLNTAWSWKARRDSSVFTPQFNKWQESKDWTFAAWSTIEYILVT